MNLYEFQAKRLLARYGIQAPMGEVAATAEEATAAARRLGAQRYVVKAQIHTVDRLGQDAVVFAKTASEVGAKAKKLFGKPFAGGAGLPPQTVAQVYVEEFVERPREIYLAIMLDRAFGRVLLVGSAAGGSSIEERSRTAPDSVKRLELALGEGRLSGDFAGFASHLASEGKVIEAIASVIEDMAAAFVGYDATLIEINPLVVGGDGHVLALDAKMTVDDNALFRRPDLARMREANDAQAANTVELGAQRHQINYMTLDGDIGVAVNGAGLALATQDLIVAAGGRPANFMDIRTTASSLDIAHGFGLLFASPKVRVILVNVHGGGMQRCDTIAEGLGIALRRAKRVLPIVIRLAGNNAEFARTVLTNNGVAHQVAGDMEEAAGLAVALARREAH
ncbi:MAG: ATP-grasp domain-containing protein [Hyphomicrobiaceae bacterium]|nr:ATP-grasp domain-containing protein [Hyphomicrobiaceae bacterium]